MALIKYAELAEEISGTVGGATFARGHDCKTVRGWRGTTNKRSTGQRLSRQAFSYISHAWRAVLTADDRHDWDVYAATCVFTSPLGVEYHLNGFNLYQRNAFILNAFGKNGPPFSPGYAPIGAPGFPDPFSPTFSLSLTSGALDFYFDEANGAPAEIFYIQVHSLRPITHTFPHRDIISFSQVVNDQGPPARLWTYAHPLPGGAADYAALVTWYERDDADRISLELTALVASS